ncbi:hypothetical protein DHL47_00825 [Streptococcus panodentis]|uniref:Uncharacterized protein n=1 Tax=Streptococcus panodentis TaxID=1581472 RepID=A0ABS5ATK0_9STRE|nr:hypothetical protein [Streptococcus panodentis]
MSSGYRKSPVRFAPAQLPCGEKNGNDAVFERLNPENHAPALYQIYGPDSPCQMQTSLCEPVGSRAELKKLLAAREGDRRP